MAPRRASPRSPIRVPPLSRRFYQPQLRRFLSQPPLRRSRVPVLQGPHRRSHLDSPPGFLRPSRSNFTAWRIVQSFEKSEAEECVRLRNSKYDHSDYLRKKLSALDPEEDLASEIISHFVMHGTSVTEIVKHLMTVLKKKDVDLALIFLEALKKIIYLLRETSGIVH